MSNVTEARPRFRKSVDSSSVKGARRLELLALMQKHHPTAGELFCPGYSFSFACVRAIKAREIAEKEIIIFGMRMKRRSIECADFNRH